MAFSVQTNRSALTALQNLNRTNTGLDQVQTRISTGLKVSGAKDNASTWAVAQGQRADIGALAAVKTSLDRATSISDVGLAAGEAISDLLNEIKAKVTAGMDPSISVASRSAINNDFKALLTQVAQIRDNAEFDGANIIDGSRSSTNPIKFIANADADQFVLLTARNLSFGQTAGIQVLATDELTSLTVATAVMAKVTASIDNVNGLLAQIGSEAKQIEAHAVFISKLNDVLETGVGNLVDADLAKESARLQALQVQQQLGAQALGIANQSPQLILSLFQN